MTVEICDGVWQVDCRTRDQPNAYVVDDGDVTLVDAGWPGHGPHLQDSHDRLSELLD